MEYEEYDEVHMRVGIGFSKPQKRALVCVRMRDVKAVIDSSLGSESFS